MKKLLFLVFACLFFVEAKTQTNIGFEFGNFLNWSNGYYCYNTCDSLSSPNPMPYSGFNFNAMNVTSDQHGLCNAGADPSVTTGIIKLPCPWGGNISARLGDVVDDCSAAKMSYGMVINPNNWDLAISYAVVLFDNHPANDAPKFIYTLRDLTSGFLIDSAYFDSNTISIDTAFHPADITTPGLYYKNWTRVCYNLIAYLGKNVQFDFITTDCDTHRGYAYLDFNLDSCFGGIMAMHEPVGLNVGVKLFPNPAFEKVNLSYKNLQNDEFEITLLNIQGDILLKDNFVCAPGQINKTYKTEDLPKGIYFVTIKTKKQGTIQKKLIVN